MSQHSNDAGLAQKSLDLLHATEPRISNAKREAILNAAERIFARDGFEGGRTLEIAQEADVSEATLFKYFGSKRGLLSALGERAVDTILRPYLISTLQYANGQAPLQETLVQIFLDRSHILKKNLPLLRVLLAEAPRDPAAFSGFVESALPSFFDLADSFHTKYSQSGVYQFADPRLASRTFLSLLMGYVYLSEILPERFSIEETQKEAEFLANVFLNGMICR